MELGLGRRIEQPSKREIVVKTMPLAGPFFARRIWRDRPIIVEREELDSPHFVIIGKTGKGKTLGFVPTLHADAMQAGSFIGLDGAGALKTHLVRNAAARRTPPDEFALIDLTYKHQELGSPLLSLLTPLPGETPGEVVERLVSDTVQASEIRQAAGFRQADISRHVFLALQEAQEPLITFCRFLISPAARGKILKKVKNPDTLAYWRAFNHLKADQQQSWGQSSYNKFSPLVLSPFVAPALSQTHSTITIPDFLHGHKQLVVDLNERRLGEEVASLLGRILISRLRSAIMAREDLSTWVTLCIDEYSAFHCASILTTMRQARQRRVRLALFSILSFLVQGAGWAWVPMRPNEPKVLGVDETDTLSFLLPPQRIDSNTPLLIG